MSEAKSAKSRNVVSDASKLPESDDKVAILKQIEFYFGDQNLPRDKFLWTATQKNNGWVPIETVAKFSRMRRFPLDAVKAALEDSTLLEVSENKADLRRKVALKEPKPEDKRKSFERTVYAKGFGAETDTSQFDIESFFEQFAPVKQVRLRRTDDGTFKSSVFVEFAELADAQAFLAKDPKPKYGDETEELLTMSKQAYVDMKAAEHGFTDGANGKRRKFNAFRQGPRGGGAPDNKRRRRDDRDRADAKDVAAEAETEAVAEISAEAETAAEVAETAAELANEKAVEEQATEAAEKEPEADGAADLVSETVQEGIEEAGA